MPFDNTNKGVLFRNGEKETDKHPDYRGDIDIDGKKYWLSAWINQSKKGNKYMSLSVKLKEQQEPTKIPESSPSHDDYDDSLPF
jgi:uncharacterized protein (DUF736 family)